MSETTDKIYEHVLRRGGNGPQFSKLMKSIEAISLKYNVSFDKLCQSVLFSIEYGH